jgi:Family of unknown function (DUF6152)
MRRDLPTPVGSLILFALGVLLLGVPAFAHHGFEFEYDGSKYVNITGTLTKVEWGNPHIYFNVDSKMSPQSPTLEDPQGKVTTWRFEGSSATLVQRTGTRRTDLVDAVGQTVTVRASPGRDAAAKGAAETVKLADGREVVVGRKRVYGGQGDSEKGSN